MLYRASWAVRWPSNFLAHPLLDKMFMRIAVCTSSCTRVLHGCARLKLVQRAALLIQLALEFKDAFEEAEALNKAVFEF